MAATSMYIAEEAIKNDDHATSALPNGLEGFAKTIESSVLYKLLNFIIPMCLLNRVFFITYRSFVIIFCLH